MDDLKRGYRDAERDAQGTVDGPIDRGAEGDGGIRGRTGGDPAGLGDEVPQEADVTFPEVRPAEGTM